MTKSFIICRLIVVLAVITAGLSVVYCRRAEETHAAVIAELQQQLYRAQLPNCQHVKGGLSCVVCIRPRNRQGRECTGVRINSKLFDGD